MSSNVYDMPRKKQNKAAKVAKRNRIILRIMLIMAILFFAYLIISFGGNLGRLYVMQEDLKKMEQKMADLEEKNSTLLEKLELIESNAYIEKVAREKLNLVKPGESKIVIDGENNEDSSDSQNNE